MSTPSAPHSEQPAKKNCIIVSHERSGTHFLMNTLALNFGYISEPWINLDFETGMNFHAPGALLAFFQEKGLLFLNDKKLASVRFSLMLFLNDSCFRSI